MSNGQKTEMGLNKECIEMATPNFHFFKVLPLLKCSYPKLVSFQRKNETWMCF